MGCMQGRGQIYETLTFCGQSSSHWTEEYVPYSHRSSGQPRVIGLAMVKNEQDIIEPMIRHNAALLDVLIVLDNASVDETRAIVLALVRELGNVIVTDSCKFGYTQGERMTQLLCAAQSSYFADFVVFLDADEFIGTTSRAAFHAELRRIPPIGFGAMMWHNFVVTDATATENPPSGLTYRRAAEVLPVYKAALRLDGVFQADLIVLRGNHSFRHLGKLLPGTLLSNLPLWHFPIRGRAQLTAKVLVGWLACLAANPRAFEVRQSDHWQSMYRRVVDGSGLDDSDLRDLSLHYADTDYVLGISHPPDPPIMHDPPSIDSTRRYSTGAFLDPLMLLARSWEETLRARDPLFTPEEALDAVIDIPPFRFLNDKHQFASVLDIACGIGLDLELFGRLGVPEPVGVGKLPPDALKLRRGGYVAHDPNLAFSLGRRYTMVLCLNTVAHQSFEDALTLIGNADRHAEAMIVFSMDDPGADHQEEWLMRWRGMGWVPDLMETLALRCLSSSALLRRGLVVLRRSSELVSEMEVSDVPEGTRELLAIARRPFQMPAPAPGVHEEALLEPAARSWLGYAA
jgi:hypothetical protein